MQFSIGNVQFQGHLGLLRQTPLRHFRHQPSDHSVVPRTLWQQIRLFEIRRTDVRNTGTATMVRHATNEMRPGNPQLQSGFGSFPVELQLQIFGELPGKDLVKMQQVCRRFNRLSNVVISNSKSDGAQEAQKKGREFMRERICQLSRNTPSSDIFRKDLEQLIANNRDIGIEIAPGSYLHDPKHINIVLSVVRKQTHLRSLQIGLHQVDKKVERIISTLEAVSNKCNLTELHVSIDREVTSAQAESLANMLALKSIHMGLNSKLGYHTLQALLANPATTHINLTIRDEQEDAAEWMLVKQALAGNKAIEKMVLEGVTDEALAAIAPALEENKSLKALMLVACRPKSHGLQALSAALTRNTCLTTLILQSSGIDDAGVAALAPALKHNRTLRELTLHGNHLTSQGAQALVQSLKHNTTLTKLKLS